MFSPNFNWLFFILLEKTHDPNLHVKSSTGTFFLKIKSTDSLASSVEHSVPYKVCNSVFSLDYFFHLLYLWGIICIYVVFCLTRFLHLNKNNKLFGRWPDLKQMALMQLVWLSCLCFCDKWSDGSVDCLQSWMFVDNTNTELEPGLAYDGLWHASEDWTYAWSCHSNCMLGRDWSHICCTDVLQRNQLYVNRKNITDYGCQRQVLHLNMKNKNMWIIIALCGVLHESW